MTEPRRPLLSSAQITATIDDLKASQGDPPWAVQLVRSDDFMVTVICQAPGHQNDWHYHLSPECWSIHEGELAWTLEGHPAPFVVRAGDWIMVPANTYHLIEVRGDQPSIRIAVVHPAEYHRHDRPDAPPRPQPRSVTNDRS